MAALQRVAEALFKDRYGIDLESPPELLRLALGKSDVVRPDSSQPLLLHLGSNG
jgi:hypothetical protein